MKEQVLEEYLEIQNEIIAECNRRLEEADRFDANGILQTKMLAANGIFAALREYDDLSRKANDMTEWREMNEGIKAANAQTVATLLRQETVLDRIEAALETAWRHSNEAI